MNRLFMIVLTGFLIFLLPQQSRAEDAAQIRMTSPEGKPLKNMMIYIFNGDINAKGTASELYPYSAVTAKTKMTYLGEVKTDNNGNFQIFPDTYSQRSLVLRSGSIYAPVWLEKSSDLSHTPSADHLRVVEWVDENGSVKANHLYNWRAKTLVTIPLQGEPSAETQAEFIQLPTYYIKKIAPWSLPPLSDSDADHLLRQLAQMTYQPNLLENVHSAMSHSNPKLRVFAAQYLGKFGTYKSVSYLIDELTLGKDADARAAAVSALKELTGGDFGANALAWKEWMSERNLAIEKIENYLQDSGKANLDIYRIHLNKEKTQWGASLQNKNEPDQIGNPALSVDRTTGAINFIMGR